MILPSISIYEGPKVQFRCESPYCLHHNNHLSAELVSDWQKSEGTEEIQLIKKTMIFITATFNREQCGMVIQGLLSNLPSQIKLQENTEYCKLVVFPDC